MDNISATMAINIALSADNSDIGGSELGVAKDVLNITRGQVYSNGTGSGQCDVIYHAVLAITSLDTIDFNGAVLKDAFGANLAITKLKGLYIRNLMGGAMEISNDGANIFPLFDAAADIIHIPDDGEILVTWPGDGMTIGGATGKIEFTHAVGGAQSVEIVAVGVR